MPSEPNRPLGDTLCCLVYMSTATAPLDWDDICAIEGVSQRNNSSLDVTGLLLFSGSHFVQFLEGPARSIDETFFDRIDNDPRHGNFVTLVHEAIEQREFSNWSMAVKSVEHGVLVSIPEFPDYESAADSFSPTSRMGVRIRKVLLTFRMAS